MARTPREQEYTTFQHAVERGYAVVIVDVRGRYHSDGEFRPYENEGRDGYDTIEWAAVQPWSNGNGWHIWTFLSGGRSVGGGGGESSALKGDGSSDDVLDAAKLFLCWRHLGHVVDGMDLGQHCLGYSG